MLAVTFYSVVIAVHVMAVVAAFGVLFAWPLLATGTPEAHAARLRILQRLVSPAAVIALIAGIYLASDAGVWDEVWVTVPLLVLLVVMGVIGAYVTPRERALSRGEGTPQTAATLTRAMLGCGGLVLVAVLFMVTKLGG